MREVSLNCGRGGWISTHSVSSRARCVVHGHVAEARYATAWCRVIRRSTHDPPPAALPPDQQRHGCPPAARELLDGPPTHWARRSLLVRRDSRLLVTEVFLPAILTSRHDPNERLDVYEKLMRLDKPIGIRPLLVTPRLWLSATVIPTRYRAILILGVMTRSAGCIINDVADRNFDPHVERTQFRPRPPAQSLPAPVVAGVLIALAFAWCYNSTR